MSDKMSIKNQNRHITESILLLFIILVVGVATVQAQSDVTLSPSGKLTSGGGEYRKYCAQCHGISGTGDGPVASELKTPPPNLTLLAKNNNGTFPYQNVYDAISGKNLKKAHGTREMPIFSLQFAQPRNSIGIGGPVRRSQYQVDQEIKRITDYIKTIQQP
jgi:mono/diheme cytochrome c family protein